MEDGYIKVGSKVSVNASIEWPIHGWGNVSHSSVGVVTRLDDDGQMRINFPEQEGWMGQLEEMVLIANKSGMTDLLIAVQSF